MDEFVNNWVAPYYLKILHGNYCYLKGDEQKQFTENVNKALTSINDEVMTRLLAGGWREQITGSWFCGLIGWSQHADTIGTKLVESKLTYAGQSHSFALACFASDNSIKYLVEYLDFYLPKTNLVYDQAWAMPALMWIDEQTNTNHAGRFLIPGGPWENFVAGKDPVFWRLEDRQKYFWNLMNYCIKNFMKSRTG